MTRLLFWPIGVLLVFPASAAPYQLDEFLQATRVALARDRVVLEIDLTPGVSVAPRVFALIDTDRDRQISAAEGRAYAQQVLEDVVLRLDDERRRLTLVRADFPSLGEMSAGLGTIHLEARSDAPVDAPGGHHLAINVTVAGSQTVLTPSHTGAQPAAYSLNGRTIRPLGAENDKAFALMNALNAAQQKQALLDYQVRNIVLGPGQDGKVIQPEGVRVSGFSADQRAMLLDLVREWVDILNDNAAAARMAEVRANLADTYFAWCGSTTNGKGAYFRIQGPTLMIEYAPQGGVDHIHTIYRDPTNDYGSKLGAR